MHSQMIVAYKKKGTYSSAKMHLKFFVPFQTLGPLNLVIPESFYLWPQYEYIFCSRLDAVW